MRGVDVRSIQAASVAVLLAAALLVAGCGQNPAQPEAASGSSVPPAAEAGNGISDKSIEEIFTAAEAALRSADSVRVRMDMKDAGQVLRGDLELAANGDISGWIELDGVRVNTIVVDGEVYVRSREAMQRELGADAARAYGDRWIKQTKAQAREAASYTSQVTVEGFADLFGKLDASAFTRKGVETVDGQLVVRLKGVDSILDVMATGEPYPVRVKGTDKNGEAVSMELSDYGKDFKIKAPADPIDLNKLPG
jgi:hypothetical protein